MYRWIENLLNDDASTQKYRWRTSKPLPHLGSACCPLKIARNLESSHRGEVHNLGENKSSTEEMDWFL